MIPFNVEPQNYPVGALEVECYISTSANATNSINGTWLSLNDKETFTIAKGSFEETAVQFRREEVTNPFVEGKFLVNALRDNITTSLIIRASGTRTYDTQYAVQQLTDALSQVTFKMITIIDGAKKVYNCYASDFSISSPQEMMHSRMATVSAQITHAPVVVLSEDL